ncbi:MAG: hypothetical protein ACNS62_06460 [Candidatus Cyclobacteriaceae bacterium M3_2C_046]
MTQKRKLVSEEAILIVCVGIEFFEQYGQGQEYHAIEIGRIGVVFLIMRVFCHFSTQT